MEVNRSITLSQLQQILGNTIRMNPNLQNVWVTAELSDLRVAGGHCYMELIEKDSKGSTCAKMRAMIWANMLMPLRSKFYAATGRDIANGIKVMVRGSVNHHNLYGLSFVISDIDPSYTMGDMERLRREILERLHREGILENNKKLNIPMAPQRIAVVSAAGAAGYGDFINQLNSNPDGFKFYPFLFPAVMQGERTSASVRRALQMVESTIDLWDCVVIIRGGGATTDLNGFDEYELAKSVALFPLPVVVGIGHERDRTVLDEIACVRCKTPTAVASYLIDTLRVAYTNAVDNVHRIARYASERLKGENYRLATVEASLPAIVESRLLRAEKQLTEIVHGLELGSKRMVNRQNEKLQRLTHQLEINVSKRQGREKERLSMIRYRYGRALEKFLEKPSEKLRNIENLIKILSPENTLRRGYSITRVDGKALREVGELKEGMTIETRLMNGTLRSEVKQIEK